MLESTHPEGIYVFIYIDIYSTLICGIANGLFICLSEPMCSHVTPTFDCKVTVCAHIHIVYLIEQAS